MRIRFLREKTDNTSAPYRDFAIGAGSQLSLTDVIYTQFGVTGKGALELWTQDGAYFTPNARSYTTSEHGSFGHEIQGQDWLVYGGQQAFTSGVHLGDGYRTNIGVASVSDSSITVLGGRDPRPRRARAAPRALRARSSRGRAPSPPAPPRPPAP